MDSGESMNRMKQALRPTLTAKILAAATVGLVFGMLSIYGLLNPELRVLETELARTSEQLILQESQIADLTSEKKELAVEKENGYTPNS